MSRPSAVFTVRRLAVVIVALGAGYAWWVTNRYEQLNSVNQAELASAGIELQRAMENALGTVGRFIARKSDPKTRAQELCTFDLDQPYLEFAGDCAAEQGTFSNPRLSVEHGIQIVADRAGQSEPASWHFRVDTLVNELAIVDSFQLIFIADAKGKVLYQNTPSQRSWRRMLRWGEQTFRDSAAVESEGPRVHDLATLLGGAEASDQGAGWARLYSVSDRATAQIAGQWAQVYTQPVAGGRDIGLQLVLGGAVPSQQLVRGALAIETNFFAFLVVALLLGGLGLPFIKLAAMSEHERLRLKDVYWLYVSCAALLMLSVFTVLGIDTYTRWTTQADQGMRDLAQRLRGNIVDEVEDIQRALHRYDAAAVALTPAPNCEPVPLLDNWFARDEYRGARGPFEGAPEAFIRQAAWIGPDGQQVWKVTSDPIGKLQPVTARAYFRAVRDGHLYQRPGGPGPFFIVPDRSITDGKFYTFVAMPSRLDDARCGRDAVPTAAAPSASRRAYVAVASTWLLSVEQPALPHGYGFAVVDRDGRALYHSDPRLSLRENLFDHLSDSDGARAIAHAAVPATLSTRYRGVSYRLHFEPLPWRIVPDARLTDGDGRVGHAAGLTVVVFRDESTERAVVARAFIVSLLGPMLLLLGILGVGLWAAGRMSTKHEGGFTNWLWPHEGRVPLYKVQAGIYAAILVAFVCLHAVTGADAVYLALPVCTAVAGLMAYTAYAGRGVTRSPLRGFQWYLLQFALLVSNVVLVPAFALFTLTIGHEFGTLIRSEQRWMDTRKEDAALSLEAIARSELYPEAIGHQIATAHQARQAFWPSPYDAEPEVLAPADRPFLALHEGLDRSLPIESQLTARLRYLDVPDRYNPPGAVGSLSLPGLFGLGAIMAALLVWVRWSAVHLHFADEPSVAPVPTDRAAESWAALSRHERHVLMQVSREGIANPHQRPVVRSLIARGFIQMAPTLQPSSDALQASIQAALSDPRAMRRLDMWERTHDGHSWREVRAVLLVAMVVVALFLLATQPGLQSVIAGTASGLTAVGAAAMKMRETVGEWFRRPKRAA